MTSRASLAIALSRLKGFSAAKAALEQYITPSEIAADTLWRAYMAGHVEGRRIADLGCGTGILGIGALLLGATHVDFVEKDADALRICKANVASLGLTSCHFHEQDVEGFTSAVDTVLQNPPFGTKREHADRVFLLKAFSIAKTVYSFHKSSTHAFVKAVSEESGWVIEERMEFCYSLGKTMRFHTKRKQDIFVTCFVMHPIVDKMGSSRRLSATKRREMFSDGTSLVSQSNDKGHKDPNV